MFITKKLSTEDIRILKLLLCILMIPFEFLYAVFIYYWTEAEDPSKFINLFYTVTVFVLITMAIVIFLPESSKETTETISE